VAEDPVLIEQDGDVAVITLNRPRSHNALNGDLLRRLDDCVAQVLRNGNANAVVVTGAGQKSFCAGADLDELAGLDAAASRELLGFGQHVMQRIATSRLPIIAAVNGLALGGGFELVLASTFPVLAESASLGLPEAGLGLIPGYGGTQRLPRVIGRASAAHLMLTGERLSAERAYHLGLTPVSPVPVEDLLAATLQIAHTIAGRGPRAVSAILEAMHTSSADVGGLALETALAAIANSGEEAREGIAAFKERRAARFASRQGTSRRPQSAWRDEDGKEWSS
jgi:enoyl-CoA hydratase